MSFRDKLQPGDNEEWRLKITGPKKEQVAAQFLGAMYDASLDEFLPHSWSMSVWQDRCRFPADCAGRGGGDSVSRPQAPAWRNR